ncbi:MAG: hypothetical protein K0S99_1808 [Thermomicrobiales bacterium]|jgi:hypothetical protein|nr:hypothetical protein [Thermomicrobiales bacterium]
MIEQRMTDIQKRYPAIPERPKKANDRAWSLFVEHIARQTPYTELARREGVTQTRIRQIVTGVHVAIQIQRGRMRCPYCYGEGWVSAERGKR